MSRKTRLLFHFAAGLLSASLLVNQDAKACESAEILQPVLRSSVADPAPLIVWRKIHGTDVYRVEIESRMPEGEVLKSFDLNVEGNSFQVPEALTQFRAAVKVRVSSGCPVDQGNTMREAPATFFIDTATQCPAPQKLSLSADARKLEWKPESMATRYAVSVLRAQDGSLLERSETQQPFFNLTAGEEPRFAVVRSYCGDVHGAESWLGFKSVRANRPVGVLSDVRQP